VLFPYFKIVLALFERTLVLSRISVVFCIHSNASTNLKCVTLQFVNNVDMMEHSSPIKNHQRDVEIDNDSHLLNHESCDRMKHKSHNLILLSCNILLVRDLIIGINYTLFYLISWQVLFTCSVIWHPCDLVTFLQAVSMQYHWEGSEYISLSLGWTNPTLDPWS
jgi:hypothetical protein